MMNRSNVKLGALVCGLTVVATAASVHAQTSEYYMHTGDQNTFIVVQNGAILRTWTPPSDTDQYQYPMVVRDTIRTMGANEGTIGGEYDLNGVDLGPRYTHPAGPSRCWDGATDGTNFYSIDSGGEVWKFDDTWQNPQLLFSVSGLGSLAYDPANDSLWVSQFSGDTITEYTMAGSVLRSWSTGHTQNMALALDPADDTLWTHDRTAQGTLEQWTKDGSQLQRVAVPGLNLYNALSGEFQFGPGACLRLANTGYVGGQPVTWTVSGGTPGFKAVVVYGFNAGNLNLNNYAASGRLWCATIDIAGVNPSKIVGNPKVLDAAGEASWTKTMPLNQVGNTILTQAVGSDTCPDDCQSSVDSTTVQ